MTRYTAYILLAFLLWPSASWAAIAFGDTDSGTEDGADTSFTTTALTVNAGDAIVCAVKWETAGALTSISDGTNSLTLTTNQTYVAGAATIRGGYLANAAGAGSGAFTFTFDNAGAEYKRGACVTYTGVETGTAFDVQNTATDALETDAETGSVTTTNADDVCVAWGGAYTSGTWTSPTINAVAATSRFSGSDFAMYDRIVSATFTGEGTVHHNLGSDTAGAIVCLKAAAGGGGGAETFGFYKRRAQ